MEPEDVKMEEDVANEEPRDTYDFYSETEQGDRKKLWVAGSDRRRNWTEM